MPWAIFEALFRLRGYFCETSKYALDNIQGAIQYKSRCHYMERAREEGNKKTVI